jgi:hypothetical protein
MKLIWIYSFLIFAIFQKCIHSSRVTKNEEIRVTPLHKFDFINTIYSSAEDEARKTTDTSKAHTYKSVEFIIETNSSDTGLIDKKIGDIVKLSSDKNISQFKEYTMNFHKLPNILTSEKIRTDSSAYQALVLFIAIDPYLQYRWVYGKFVGIIKKDKSFFTE